MLVSVLSVLQFCGLNLPTHDTSATAQAFFAFPVLWAAATLRARGAALVIVTALAVDCASLFLLLPPASALTDLVFGGAALTTIAVMLVRANAAQDRLAKALKSQVTVDSLTGLAARRAFDEAWSPRCAVRCRAGRRWCSSTSTPSSRATTTTATP